MLAFPLEKFFILFLTFHEVLIYYKCYRNKELNFAIVYKLVDYLNSSVLELMPNKAPNRTSNFARDPPKHVFKMLDRPSKIVAQWMAFFSSENIEEI